MAMSPVLYQPSRRPLQSSRADSDIPSWHSDPGAARKSRVFTVIAGKHSVQP